MDSKEKIYEIERIVVEADEVVIQQPSRQKNHRKEEINDESSSILEESSENAPRNPWGI
ncbi:hypothetical protein [Halobacillus trueperi]|uniref:hypothetical protein n=1 Tax=Halobacillus trueperi TaxID=156205 RepID=UPI0015F253BE|nr:hypothetical protein [Halobacillus trueperi]